jgi:hypothetical protein
MASVVIPGTAMVMEFWIVARDGAMWWFGKSSIRFMNSGGVV